MSVPRHDVSRGELIYKGRKYKVLNRPLSNKLLEKCNRYYKRDIQPSTTTLWMFHRCKWEIRKKKLYLTEMFQSELLKSLTEKNELQARWVDRLSIYVATEIPISRNKNLGKEILHRIDFIFSYGKYVRSEKYASTDYGIQMKRMVNYMGVQEGVFTFTKECIDFGGNGVVLDCGDKLVRYVENDINNMMNKSINGIDLSIDNFKDIARGSKKLMYLCDAIDVRDDLSKSKKKKEMKHFGKTIVDKVQTVLGKSTCDYLIQIELDKNFFFQAIELLVEILSVDLGDNIVTSIKYSDEYHPSDEELAFLIDGQTHTKTSCAVVKIFAGQQEDI